MCSKIKMDEKLAIVVPYRNRKEHLDKFLPAMESCSFLDGIDYEILIVEQEGVKPFNRGKILNVGAVYSKNSTYYCFHDVDMLPISSDYSYVSVPTHLASEAEQFGFKLPYNGYFGGVTLFDKHSFIKINGYSNDYWGWGAEDDDVMFRCIAKGIRPERKIGRYSSLSHERVITQDLYNENLRKFFDFKNAPNLEFINQRIDSDGLNTLSYEIIEEEKLGDKVTLIKVSI
jgi:predicted glycosyltransferase involved in capsule biosynthesis